MKNVLFLIFLMIPFAAEAKTAQDNFDKLVDPDPAVPEVLNDRAADNWRPLLAIADLAGGTWPEDARRAASTLSGEEGDGAVNVELLRDMRAVFGDDDAVRSADLVAKLIADPERPWAEWKHGRPLTQKQLGGLLRPFGIMSETVSIPGFNDAKGYRRAHFEEVWSVYCPGQNAVQADFPLSKRRSVGMPMKSAQVRDFRSVAEPPGDGSKNGKLSYSHAGFDASTLRKPGRWCAKRFRHDRGPLRRPWPHPRRPGPYGSSLQLLRQPVRPPEPLGLARLPGRHLAASPL